MVEQEAQKLLTIDLSENKVLGRTYLRGREEGRYEGQIMLLRRQIEQRFSSLPWWAQQKLGEYSAQDLETIGTEVRPVGSDHRS